MQISDQVIQVLDAICEKFGIAIDWSANNILPYIQDLFGRVISYEIAKSIFKVSLFAILTIISFMIYKIFLKRCWVKFEKEDKEYHSDIKTPFAAMCHYATYEKFEGIVATVALVVTCILAIIFVLMVFTQIFNIIECVYLPEKIFIEFIKGFNP